MNENENVNARENDVENPVENEASSETNDSSLDESSIDNSDSNSNSDSDSDIDKLANRILLKQTLERIRIMKMKARLLKPRAERESSFDETLERIRIMKMKTRLLKTRTNGIVKMSFKVEELIKILNTLPDNTKEFEILRTRLETTIKDQGFFKCSNTECPHGKDTWHSTDNKFISEAQRRFFINVLGKSEQGYPVALFCSEQCKDTLEKVLILVYGNRLD